MWVIPIDSTSISARKTTADSPRWRVAVIPAEFSHRIAYWFRVVHLIWTYLSLCLLLQKFVLFVSLNRHHGHVMSRGLISALGTKTCNTCQHCYLLRCWKFHASNQSCLAFNTQKEVTLNADKSSNGTHRQLRYYSYRKMRWGDPSFSLLFLILMLCINQGFSYPQTSLRLN